MTDLESTPLRLESRAEPGAVVSDYLCLTHEERTRSRLVSRLASGGAAVVALPRAGTLRHGDRLRASDGRVVEVRAASETLLDVKLADAAQLARAAYHLGNRHVAVEVRAGGLRVAHDAVLERLLQGLGLAPTLIEAPFEPEGGAYGAAHSHLGGSVSPASVIHEYHRS